MVTEEKKKYIAGDLSDESLFSESIQSHQLEAVEPDFAPRVCNIELGFQGS